MIEDLAHFYARYSTLVDQIGINALLALSLSVCLRAGQLALAQAAFMGIAGYLSAIAVVDGHWPLVLAGPAAIAASTIVGALLALPVERLRGVFLAIATIGFGEIVRVVADNLAITGGAEGFTGIPPVLSTPWIYAALAIVGAIVFAARRSRFALAIQTTREDEAAAQGVGIDTGMVRVATLACAGAIAGLAGVLYAFTNFFITPADFAFGRMEQILVYCVIGGVTSPLGAVVGAALMTVLPEIFRFLHDYREIVDGLVLLVVIIFAPAGLAGLWRGLKPRERRPAAALPQ
ncbi:MAG: branched-chain amino acid ABC transporter permease [Candidatus Eremiobacteraeota bacterium]|nr:branched-chain amino acid ABC transporter permease [Candidatus Eremiobacteraeota bacterium]MBV8355576.1 branched-chain amino acid ABC transporter permease [Candidatus Eremiobacteraeota bacterium]